ncbi:DUF2399 domain-containing protein [Bacillus zhangzhouensis]|uniref:DUF2399 domain-containing protein n=1 Tax=Bacillus zhangzhouensis TaxID=1178540 RepID=UPI002813B55D|nr:DUF2399 domain-containing protein [Bacillus zhangzhouensis]MDR0124199.1 DUF2399 domain-containing protein [Bacillus zhangzhouensis]
MIDKKVRQYIEDYILRSKEELELTTALQDQLFTQFSIIKRSARTYRVLGLLTVSTQHHHVNELPLDPALASLALTTNRKVELNEDEQETFDWLKEGWIIKEIRFEKDGKTVSRSHYRMGYRLFEYQSVQHQRKHNELVNDVLMIQDRLNEIALNKGQKQQTLSPDRVSGIKKLTERAQQLNPSEMEISLSFPTSWPLMKRLKYLHFVCAFCHISSLKESFDWKEIGATYYHEIGGSKKFDTDKEEFISEIEDWSYTPIQELGLTSLGQITPVFFSGILKGQYSSYEIGPVHAITNLSILNETYHTDATTFWIVENRAILTSMASKRDFLKETKSYVLCTDGHLRSAHRKAMTQILDHSQVKQVMIWCDYDVDGLYIARKVYETLNPYDHLKLKWILPNQKVAMNHQQYEQYLTDFLQHQKMEQEQMMGGVDLWKKWIQD